MEASELDVLGPVDHVVVEFPAAEANISGEMAGGVLGGPGARTAAVVGTAAVVKHGRDRRENRRDDRDDRREDRRDDRGPGILR
jgi:hypothetical protein